jgi:hypothetical protein
VSEEVVDENKAPLRSRNIFTLAAGAQNAEAKELPRRDTNNTVMAVDPKSLLIDIDVVAIV